MQYRSTGSEGSSAALAAIHAALFAVLVGVLVATLAPFQVQAPGPWPRALRHAFAVRWPDVVLNLALLAPLGFLSAMRRRSLRRGREPLVRALWTGALLSVSIESLQLFVPSRCPSAVDVAGNALGFAAGTLALERAGLWVERALLWLARPRISVPGSALFCAVLAALALAPLNARAQHDGLHWTLGPLAKEVRASAILLALGAALLAYALALLLPRVRRAWM